MKKSATEFSKEFLLTNKYYAQWIPKILAYDSYLPLVKEFFSTLPNSDAPLLLEGKECNEL